MTSAVLEKTEILRARIETEIDKIMWGKLHIMNTAKVLKHLYGELGITIEGSDIDLYAMFSLIESEAEKISESQENLELLAKEIK